MLTSGECNEAQLLQRKSVSSMQSVVGWLLFISICTNCITETYAR